MPQLIFRGIPADLAANPEGNFQIGYTERPDMPIDCFGHLFYERYANCTYATIFI